MKKIKRQEGNRANFETKRQDGNRTNFETKRQDDCNYQNSTIKFNNT
jgi:hypothetical protein